MSHSGKDVGLASELTELLRAGIGLRAEQIRCSSVDGYRLPGGANTEDQLRAEINAAKVLIGLITPNSLSSTYVLFELGARWGAKLFMIPLLAGIKPEEMHGPLSLLNALSCNSEHQLHQLLADVARPLGLSPQSPPSYLRYLNAVKQKAEAMQPASLARPVAQGEMIFEESVYWKRNNGDREGPYCPACYEDKHKEIHLTPGATRGVFSCPTCKNRFTTKEYPPRRRYQVPSPD
jgi:hypothetical protein